MAKPPRPSASSHSSSAVRAETGENARSPTLVGEADRSVIGKSFPTCTLCPQMPARPSVASRRPDGHDPAPTPRSSPDGGTSLPPLLATAEGAAPAHTPGAWRRWGPYLSERQWGTVREDYSEFGTAWDSTSPHDHARSQAYRWGEDGIGGFSDNQQRWCLSVALWNEADPILKERLFGPHQRTGQSRRGCQGGLLLQRRPADPFLHADALQIPAGRLPLSAPDRREPQPRLSPARSSNSPTAACSTRTAISTSASNTRRMVPTTILMRLTLTNRGPQSAPLHALPQLFARNIWSWAPGTTRPLAACHLRHHRDRAASEHAGAGVGGRLPGRSAVLRERHQCPPPVGHAGRRAVQGRLQRLPDRQGGRRRRLRQARHQGGCAYPDPTRRGRNPRAAAAASARPSRSATKAPACSPISTRSSPTRIAEADAFYAALQSGMHDPDARAVQRQALRGPDLEQAVSTIYDIKASGWPETPRRSRPRPPAAAA